VDEKLTFDLDILPGTYNICRLPSAASLPEWATSSDFYSVTRTPDELSIVCSEDVVPQEVERETGWACLKVQGPLDFSMTGVLSALAGILANAGISLFAISTFETDYLLVKWETLPQALAGLERAGHCIRK
jgi:hypothetical protein